MITKLLNGNAIFTHLIPTPHISLRVSRNYSDSSSSRTLLYSSNTTNFNIKCSCSRDENAHQSSPQNFSVLGEDSLPWETKDLWTTMAFYMLSLHIPLSFGWINIASELLQQQDLDLQTRAISLLVAQSIELAATFTLLKLTAVRSRNVFKDLFFESDRASKDRNWLLASAIGFGFLFALVFATSFFTDGVFESKAVNNSAVRDILMDNNNISKASLVFVYCVIAPVLEETVYRGFLLRSLSSTMKWQNAILISSVIFSASHLSGENFVQLFIVGCVFGCSYCWTGNLASSIAIHSLYNAMTLIMTALSKRSL